jgi:AcrR family transcriptional regulator
LTADAALAAEPPSLRAAHKELTRSRIRDAARELFYRQGYGGTTMDQIAVAAGVRRSTLYFHFRDKDEIVRRIAEEYMPKAKAVQQRLPGPRPTRVEIAAWMVELADFVKSERAPMVLFRDMTGVSSAPIKDVRSLGDEILESMSANIPAFRAALEPGEGQATARAWAEMVLREVTRACLYASRPDAGPEAAAELKVAGDLFFQFTEGRMPG